jgi:hypothetical protein
MALPAASPDGDQFVRVAEIDLLDDHGLAKTGGTNGIARFLSSMVSNAVACSESP